MKQFLLTKAKTFHWTLPLSVLFLSREYQYVNAATNPSSSSFLNSSNASNSSMPEASYPADVLSEQQILYGGCILYFIGTFKGLNFRYNV